MLIQPLLCLLCLLGAPLVARAQSPFDLATTQTRLPKTVLPSHVHLALTLDPAADTFAGDARIRLTALQAVPAIVLHAQALQAESATLSRPGLAPRTLAVQADSDTQTWRLTPVDGRPIVAGVWTLRIRYRGQVQTTGEGLYRATYRHTGHNGQSGHSGHSGQEQQRMLATQLEAAHARKLLPVFDEPVFRSVFELEVTAPQGLQVFSNMPLKQVQKQVQRQVQRQTRPQLQTPVAAQSTAPSTRHRFAPTPPMPSYLLALTVGQFEQLEDRVDGIPLRILTVPGKREQARFAMEVTRQVLPFYARYFGRPYALPKLDQLAVPGTREGAMEDWGLISYVEDSLLFDPSRSNQSVKRGVFTVVAHEIAHQWFGNLVSAASWDEIWLNEAFATWMEQKAAAHFHPEWQTTLRRRANVENTMARDATAATRAIRSGPVSEASVFEVFDGVTYDKGGAVLSMLETWLGEAVFQRGLAAYMAERAYKPATAGDLWAHMARAADLPTQAVADVALSWTNQPGLPVLAVTERCENGQSRVTLKQQRFSSLPEPLAGGPWQIPLRLMRGAQTQSLLMLTPEQTVSFAGCESLPLLANAGGHGYYRVQVDGTLQTRLAQAFSALAPADRVVLLSDSFELAHAGRQPMAGHLALLNALPQTTDASRAALFAVALTQWRQLDVALHDTPAQAPLRRTAWALFGPELQRLGWQEAAGEDSETQVLRASLITRLALLDHAPTLSAAHARFDAALSGAPSVPPSIRAAVLVAAGSDASEAEFDALLAALRNTNSHEERWSLVHALAAGKNANRVQRLFAEALTGNLPHDIRAGLPEAVAQHPTLAPMAYDFVAAQWGALAQLAGEGPFGGRYWLLPSAASSSSDPAVADRLISDQQRLAGAPGASTAARIAAQIHSRSRLRLREAQALGLALSAPAAAMAPGTASRP